MKAGAPTNNLYVVGMPLDILLVQLGLLAYHPASFFIELGCVLFKFSCFLFQLICVY